MGDWNSYVGGVVGNSSGEITNCYNTGEVSGADYIGGVAGKNASTITNCYNTGEVSGTGNDNGDIGGVAGKNASTITNCYNSGAVSGNNDSVGGVAGWNESTITNCYNSGAVSSTADSDDSVGGVAGRNESTITSCYNTGEVSGADYIGGVAGDNIRGEIKYCCFDQTFISGIFAVGHESGGTTQYVYGFDTSQMTGTNAMEAIGDTVFMEDPWLMKADGKDADTSEYYWYYPHLKGFDYDKSLKVKDWPPKVTVKAELNGSEPYTYNGSAQGSLKQITISNGSTDVTVDPKDYTVSYYVKNGDTYTAVAGDIVNVGSYKAVITFNATGHEPIEKEFEISKAPQNPPSLTDSLWQTVPCRAELQSPAIL